jgi:hypothetical protein
MTVNFVITILRSTAQQINIMRMPINNSLLPSNINLPFQAQDKKDGAQQQSKPNMLVNDSLHLYAALFFFSVIMIIT